MRDDERRPAASAFTRLSANDRPNHHQPFDCGRLRWPKKSRPHRLIKRMRSVYANRRFNHTCNLYL